MRQNDQKPEVACTLDEDRAGEREQEVRSELLPHYVRAEELEDGYTLVFDNAEETFQSAAEFISDERQCCSFATYRLTIDPPYEETRMTITGPDGTKELFKEGLIERIETEAPIH